MNLQVLPLKVLATRVVVMQRMDYSTYLTGTTKEELDKLDKLKGRYKVKSSKLTIGTLDNEKLWKTSPDNYVEASDDLEYFKECFGKMVPSAFIKFIGDTKEFSIVELKNGPRNWVVFDLAYWTRVFLEERGRLAKTRRLGLWSHCDGFIEDGKLVMDMKILNSKMEVNHHSIDSITTDKQGNITWNFMFSAPNSNIKITKVMWALREDYEMIFD